MKSQRIFLIIVILISPLILFAILFFVSASQNRAPDVPFVPQHTKRFEITGQSQNSIDVLATTLPQFAVRLADSQYADLWRAHAQERKISTDIVNIKGDTTLTTQTKFDDSQKQVVVTPLLTNKVKPGLYKLAMTVKTFQGRDITITQDFTWGVLAVNTPKATYQPGETVKIGMAVLDDFGATKCKANGPIVYGTANVWLTVTGPQGKETHFSTVDNTISGSKACLDRSVTNDPDFQAFMTATTVGKYIIHMEAETLLGKRSIDDTFMVTSQTPPFVVERTIFPTRIYPRAAYPVTVAITPKNDYDGPVTDIVPSSFQISQISDGGTVSMHGEYQTIQWHVQWRAGQSESLSYTIKFPQIAPQFYLIGPLNMGSFSDGREWQVASDSLFSLIQEKDNTAASGTSVSATFSSAASVGHLIVMLCYRTANNNFNTPTGWTRVITGSSSPRVYIYYRVAAAGFQTGSCTPKNNSGEIAIQMLEFSGNSSSGVFDKATTVVNASCNTGAHQSTTNSLTPTNPDELLVSGFSSNTSTVTVSSHKAITGASSTGFTDTDPNGANGFQGGSGTYDSGWGEAVNNPPTVQNDVATYSAGAGTCENAMVAFNSTITVSQGSYRFFDQSNSVDPGSVLAAQNTSITLTRPNQSFRLRILLDVDSASGNTLALDGGDFILMYGVRPASNDCSLATYSDVLANGDTSGHTDIAFSPQDFFFQNSSGSAALSINANANDPSDSGNGYTTVLQNYEENHTPGDNTTDITNHANALSNNQAGEWDLSLMDNTDQSLNQSYCLKITNSDGTDLNAYRNYPQITLATISTNIRGNTTLNGNSTIR